MFLDAELTQMDPKYCPKVGRETEALMTQSISLEKLSTQFVHHVAQAPYRIHWHNNNRALLFIAHFRCHHRAYPEITRLAENGQLHFDFDEIRCPAIFAADSQIRNENAAWKEIYFSCPLEKSWLDRKREIDISLVVLESLQSFERKCVEFEPCEINSKVGARWRIGKLGVLMSLSSMIVIIDACFDDNETSNDARALQLYPTNVDVGEPQDQWISGHLNTASGPELNSSSYIINGLPAQKDSLPKAITLAPNFDVTKYTNLYLNSQSWCPPCNFSFEHISQFVRHLEVEHKIPIGDSDPELLHQICIQCNNLANEELYCHSNEQFQDRSSSDTDSAIDVQSLCSTPPGTVAAISRAATYPSWGSDQHGITWGSQNINFTCHVCRKTYRSGGSLAESLKAHITTHKHQHAMESERLLHTKSEKIHDGSASQKYTYEIDTCVSATSHGHGLENLFLPVDNEKCPEWEPEIQDNSFTGNETEDISVPSSELTPDSEEQALEQMFPKVEASSNCENFDTECKIECRPDNFQKEKTGESVMIRTEEATERLKNQIRKLEDELAKIRSTQKTEKGPEDRYIRSNGPTKKRSDFASGGSSNRSSHAEIWMELLPWINMHFEEIMGDENPGAIEYLKLGPKKIPTICITAEDSSIVDREFLERKLNELDVGYEVLLENGGVGRSVRNDRQVSVDPDSDNYEWPSSNARFQKTPSCGASIGTMDDSSNTASFGGLIQVKFGLEWRLFGLSSHHLLEDRTRETAIGKGVMNGTLDGKEFRICQPSQFHNEQTKDFLNRYVQTHKLVDAEDDHGFSEEERSNRGRDLEKLEAKLDEQLSIDEKQLYFGKVMFSSGYGRLVDMYPEMAMGNISTSSMVSTRNFGHTMDWQLIGEIPAERSTSANYVSGGMLSNLYYQDHEPITRTVSAEFFKTTKRLFKDYSGTAKADTSPPEPHCRVHGIGAMTGSQDGYLSPVPACVKLEKYGSPSMEWSFAPRYANGLGKYGDSGAWIFNDFGSVVGMILGVNPATQQTYFTPIQSVFNDIKKSLEHLGVEDVRIVEPYMDVNFSCSRQCSPEVGTTGLQFYNSQPPRYLQYLNHTKYNMIPPPLPAGSSQAWNFMETIRDMEPIRDRLSGAQKSQQQSHFRQDPQDTPSAFTDQNSCFLADSAVDFPSTPVISGRRKLSSADWTPGSSSGTYNDVGQAPRKRQRITSDSPQAGWNGYGGGGGGGGLSIGSPESVQIKMEPETPR
ncbi:hypothetical protein EDC01DRAFT_673191 [Geopyxis carbonaria]|nr:hypothetical protein EDC01DRAFT_673191 [Geopyxis carbonaria]